MTTPWFMYHENRGFTDPAHGNHDGWDFGAPSRTPLVSLTGGKVTSHTGWYPWGGEIDTKGPTGVTETFAHADRIDVHAGDTVLPGQQVGLSGGEGLPLKYSTGPHIHYSLFGGAPWDNKYAIDPSNYLNAIRKDPSQIGNLSAGAGADAGVGGGADIGQEIAIAIGEAYGKAEYNLARTVKRAAWFTLGLVLILIGIAIMVWPMVQAEAAKAKHEAYQAAKIAAKVV